VLIAQNSSRRRPWRARIFSERALRTEVEQGRIHARGQRNVTDVDVVEVLVDLTQADSLAVGMKVDVYFQRDGR
jgi:hypothetical protein